MDTPEEPTAEPDPAVPTVPVRSDGWPNLVGRRPMSNAGRDKIRRALAEGLPDEPLTDPGPFRCYLTIDPGKLIRLRGRIHAAAPTTPPTPPSPSASAAPTHKSASTSSAKP